MSNSENFANPVADNRPLSDKEVAQIQRLLSDPLSLPMSFKTWLVSYLEISDITLPMASVIGLTDTLGVGAGQSGSIALLSAGSIVLYGGTDQPFNTVDADGAVYDTTVQAGLFAVYGYRFGGSGSTFQVPNIPAPIVGTKYVIAT